MTIQRLTLLVVVLLAFAGCSGAASPLPPSPTPGTLVTSPEEAVARVQAAFPQFAGIGPLDPEVIGACCWHEAKAVEGGYEVMFTVGWGDCPAGCIDRHRWTFAVAPDGRVGPLGEDGPPVPANEMPGTAG
jgi:hypothetical protein